MTTKPFDIAHRSRLVSSWRDARRISRSTPEQLAEILERRAPDWGGWVLLPTNDAALAALADDHERLSSLLPRRGAAAPEVARTFLDKALMLEAARAVGLDVPRRYGPAEPARRPAPTTCASRWS